MKAQLAGRLWDFSQSSAKAKVSSSANWFRFIAGEGLNPKLFLFNSCASLRYKTTRVVEKNEPSQLTASQRFRLSDFVTNWGFVLDSFGDSKIVLWSPFSANWRHLVCGQLWTKKKAFSRSFCVKIKMKSAISIHQKLKLCNQEL